MGNVLIWACMSVIMIALGVACAVYGVRLRRLTDTVAKVSLQAPQMRREMQEAQELAETRFSDAEKRLSEIGERVLRLEQGAVPDYEAAKRAKDEVDAFNAGIANILGYNQKDALKRREKAAE